MRFLIVDTYYKRFLSHYHRLHPERAAMPYDDQWRGLMDECFGTADFYSSHLIELGHEATEIIPNCDAMQRRWARDHDLAISDWFEWSITWRRKVVPWIRRQAESDMFYHVMEAQIREYRPDVLYIQDINAISDEFIRRVKPYARLVVGQTAFYTAPGHTFVDYDLMLTSFPHFVTRFREQGLQSEYFRLGFEAGVLERLSDTGPKYDTVFAGGLSPAHRERTRLLEAVARRCDLDVWGYGSEILPAGSPIRKRHHGPAWALEMYQILRSSRIALNQHVEASEQYANNMRLFEATGAGALLITDQKQNLNDLFTVGKEVVAYTSIDECVELIEYYLSHEQERAEIAANGQARTLRDHTYRRRMEELVDMIGKYMP